MKGRLSITVLVDEAVIPANDPQFVGKPEIPITEYHVIKSLRELNHNVSIVGAVDDIGRLIDKIVKSEPDIIYNLTEQFRGDRKLDKNISALLEMLDIPFTGTGSIGLMLCRDKRLCKELLSLHKIRVPDFISFAKGKKIHLPANLMFPLVVKPAFEDSSEGISNASVVTNRKALLERIEFIHNRWEQAVIAEEYIQGREFYVSIMGNKRLVVFPIRECVFSSKGAEKPNLVTYRIKWNREYREKWDIRFDFAELEQEIENKVEHICKKAYRILQLRDYGRIDLRLTDDNKIYILEVNPNPDVAYGEEVAESAEKSGLTYVKFIEKILHFALRRYE